MHGVQRFHDGLNLAEVVAEYNLLCAAFMTVVERHGALLVGDAVIMAVMAFAAQQALIRKEEAEQRGVHRAEGVTFLAGSNRRRAEWWPF